MNLYPWTGKTRLLMLCVCIVTVLTLSSCQTTALGMGQKDTTAEESEETRQKTTPFAVFKTIAAKAKPKAKEKPKRQLLCEVDSGNAKYQQGWYDFKSTKFAIAKGEKLRIEMPRKRGEGSAYFLGRFDANGQKLVFCPYIEVAEGQKIPCASFYTLEEDLEIGIRRTFDVPKAVRGGYLSCKYGPKPEDTDISE